ncbi:VanW family protein [Halanaerobaculum tunisiense]
MNKQVTTQLLLVSCLLVIVLVGYSVEQGYWFSEPTKEELKINKGVTIAGKQVGDLSQQQISELLTKLAPRKDRSPQPAFIYSNEIIPAQSGRELNIIATIQQLVTANAQQEVELVYTSIKPTITKDILEEKKTFRLYVEEKAQLVKGQLIGHYTTALAADKPNRRKNIELSLEKINHFYLPPGEVFSFNQLIGAPTVDKGYQPAPIISQGEYVSKPGGGICQTSSTLYQAVAKAGLKIVERHHHSKQVNYVPAGQDATVVPGRKDFKFSNNQQQPIIIRTELIDDYVVIYVIEVVSKYNSL